MNMQEYVELLIDNGFQVIMCEGATTYCHFSIDDKIGYVQADKYGKFKFSSEHKPCRSCGTGFSLGDDGTYEPKVEAAHNACNMHCPGWSRQHVKDIKKWKSLDEYMEKSTVLKWHYVKTYSGWEGSKQDLGEYLQAGNIVDDAMYDYFLCVMPPACHSARYVQIGEAARHNDDDQPMFSTLQKIDGHWLYAGIMTTPEGEENTYQY